MKALLDLVVGLFVHLLIELVPTRVVFLEGTGRTQLGLNVISITSLIDKAFDSCSRLFELLGVKVWIILDSIVCCPKFLVD
jgi:hypothetical protein